MRFDLTASGLCFVGLECKINDRVKKLPKIRSVEMHMRYELSCDSSHALSDNIPSQFWCGKCTYIVQPKFNFANLAKFLNSRTARRFGSGLGQLVRVDISSACFYWTHLWARSSLYYFSCVCGRTTRSIWAHEKPNTDGALGNVFNCSGGSVCTGNKVFICSTADDCTLACYDAGAATVSLFLCLFREPKPNKAQCTNLRLDCRFVPSGSKCTILCEGNNACTNVEVILSSSNTAGPNTIICNVANSCSTMKITSTIPQIMSIQVNAPNNARFTCAGMADCRVACNGNCQPGSQITCLDQSICSCVSLCNNFAIITPSTTFSVCFFVTIRFWHWCDQNVRQCIQKWRSYQFVFLSWTP